MPFITPKVTVKTVMSEKEWKEFREEMMLQVEAGELDIGLFE